MNDYNAPLVPHSPYLSSSTDVGGQTDERADGYAEPQVRHPLARLAHGDTKLWNRWPDGTWRCAACHGWGGIGEPCIWCGDYERKEQPCGQP